MRSFLFQGVQAPLEYTLVHSLTTSILLAGQQRAFEFDISFTSALLGIAADIFDTQGVPEFCAVLILHRALSQRLSLPKCAR
jgi:hypothetical protein